jgi:signal transduction histidine kinase
VTAYNEHLFHDYFGLQKDPFVWLAPVWDEAGQTIIDFTYTYSNQAGLEYLGLETAQMGQITVFNSPTLTEQLKQAFFQEILTIYLTDVPTETTVYNPRIQKYGKVTRMKFRGGVLTIIQNITEERLAIQRLEEKTVELEQQKAFSNSILDASLNGIVVASALRNDAGEIIDFIIKRVNPAFTRLLGLTAEQVLEQRFLSLHPASLQSGTFSLHCNVCNTGVPFDEEVLFPIGGRESWFHIFSAKLNDGILVTFIDVTAQKQAAQRIEAQHHLLENILKNSSNGITVCDMIRQADGKITDMRILITNEAALRCTGYPGDINLSKTLGQFDAGFTSSTYFQQCVHCMESGEPFMTQYFLETTGRWLEVSVSKMDANRLIFIFTDITAIKQKQLEIEQSAEKLRTVINTSQAGFFMAKPVWNEQQEIIDFQFTMANQVLASFVSKAPEDLIGALGSQWFTRYKTNGLFDRFCHSYLTGIKQQFDFHYIGDIGETWANVMTTRLGDELLGSFTNFTPIKKLQLQLEKTVSDLQRSNASLEEFAYAASHDLQEPLRKINAFTDRLMEDLSDQLNSNHRGMFDRIQSATLRMRSLIEDLLTYSQVSAKCETFKTVKLEDVVQHVLQDLETTINDTKAHLTTSQLGEIEGDERQLRQLFQNLIGNALKYRKPDVVPQVRITGRKIKKEQAPCSLPASGPSQYHLIQVSDNGIGFEQEYAEKIFQVFQRLHGRTEYSGTGVGLAIAQKVVTNHDGFIVAHSQPGEGATFSVLLPAQ